MFCTKCGRQNDDTAKFCQGCGNLLQGPSPLSTETPLAAVIEYAGFWQRFLAVLIDAVILSVATGAVVSATFGTGIALGFFAPWLYEAFMTSSEWQATVGKRVMSIVVTDVEGRRMSF